MIEISNVDSEPHDSAGAEGFQPKAAWPTEAILLIDYLGTSRELKRRCARGSQRPGRRFQSVVIPLLHSTPTLDREKLWKQPGSLEELWQVQRSASLGPACALFPRKAQPKPNRRTMLSAEFNCLL